MWDLIKNIFKRDDFQAISTTAISGISVGSPELGAFVTGLKETIALVDEVKGKCILKGLASGLNQEKYLNELQNYVEASSDNAEFVANTMRKAFLSESKKACVLMGRIIADHVDSNSSYDKIDLIVIYAAGSATDEDLEEFISIMNTLEDGFVKTEYLSTVDWGVNCRLFRLNNRLTYGEFMKGIKRKPTEAAVRLMKYLDEIHFCFVDSLL